MALVAHRRAPNQVRVVSGFFGHSSRSAGLISMMRLLCKRTPHGRTSGLRPSEYRRAAPSIAFSSSRPASSNFEFRMGLDGARCQIHEHVIV